MNEQKRGERLLKTILGYAGIPEIAPVILVL